MAEGAAARRGLEQWRRALLAGIASDAPDLTQRQTALLLTVYLAAPPHTVRGLARALAISKPACDARGDDARQARPGPPPQRDEQDRRNVLIERTVRGRGSSCRSSATASPRPRPGSGPKVRHCEKDVMNNTCHRKVHGLVALAFAVLVAATPGAPAAATR
jgi:hypothetical protein